MRQHDRTAIVKLRTELQQCQSRQRLALTHVQALQRSLEALSESIVGSQRLHFVRCEAIAGRLERLLSGEGGAA